MPDFIPVLSDHAYVSVHFQMINHQTDMIEVDLSLGLYNMLDQGFSKESHLTQAFSNNPYNIDESPSNYDYRKKAQFRLLAEKIYNGDDVILLQEIDFLISPTKHSLAEEFWQMLRYYDYGVIVTEKRYDEYGQQPMAFIYNTRKLHFTGESKGVFPTAPGHEKRTKYRGYEATFTYLPTHKRVVITNLHLLFGHDYNADINAYLEEKEKSGDLHIMGGDLNGLLNPTSYTQLCNWNIATHFSLDSDTHTPTIFHTAEGQENSKEMVYKAFDRCLGVAPNTCSLLAHLSERSTQVYINERQEPCFAPVHLHHHTGSLNRWKQRYHFFRPPHPTVELKDNSLFDLEQLDGFLERIKACSSREELEDQIQAIHQSPTFRQLDTLGFAARQVATLMHTNPFRTFFEACDAKKEELAQLPLAFNG